MNESYYKVTRIIVVLFNFIFFITGCGILSFGIYVQIEKGDYAAVSTTKGLTASLLLIVAGFVTALISFTGCLGAFKEKKTLLWIFLIMMSLIVILEIASFIIALVYRMKLKDDLRGDMISSIEEYGKDDQEGITKGWDWMQQKFECCGVNDSLDWAKYYEKANGSHRIVPDSCCVTEKKDCGNPYRNPDHSIKNRIYNKGCFNELEDFLKYNLLTIGIIAAVLVIIELVAIILAFLLITHIKEAGEFV